MVCEWCGFCGVVVCYGVLGVYCVDELGGFFECVVGCVVVYFV